MQSVDGRLIAATAANVFMVEQGTLVTPAIRDCGVAGVMRQAVLDAALELGIRASVIDVQPERLVLADEVFVTNAVVGIRPVGELIGVRGWDVGPITRALAAHTNG